ncbi:MAG: NPCBM/NEW2 domain-containing protein [Planctomycetaceae bacterium]|nr:NPCBM/NEW2 domain-containing protein [Planctomycetaceae bacterium]
MRASEPLRVANLDVRGVQSLVLTVDFGRNGDVLDRADWCDALLVRKP